MAKKKKVKKKKDSLKKYELPKGYSFPNRASAVAYQDAIRERKDLGATKKSKYKKGKGGRTTFLDAHGRSSHVYKVQRTDKGLYKGLKQLSGSSRVVNIGATPTYQDANAVREIQLYADNNNNLYTSRKLPIFKNLTKKYKKGTFDLERSAKLWEYYVTDALMRYAKDFGGKWHKILSMQDRKLLAKEYAEATLEEFKLGNFWEK